MLALERGAENLGKVRQRVGEGGAAVGVRRVVLRAGWRGGGGGGGGRRPGYPLQVIAVGVFLVERGGLRGVSGRLLLFEEVRIQLRRHQRGGQVGEAVRPRLDLEFLREESKRSAPILEWRLVALLGTDEGGELGRGHDASLAHGSIGKSPLPESGGSASCWPVPVSSGDSPARERAAAPSAAT